MHYKTLDQMLVDYVPYDDSESASVASLRQFLTVAANPYDRSNLYAHVVCDAWVVSPDRKEVLLLVHAENKQWLAPGGHADGDPDVVASALRELAEEAGIDAHQVKALSGGNLFDVNTGHVPERMKSHGLEPAHTHFDLCFAFEADPERVTLKISDESLDLGWQPVEQALDMIMPCHRRRVQKTLKGLL